MQIETKKGKKTINDLRIKNMRNACKTMRHALKLMEQSLKEGYDE